jgi:2-polyprenyl-3-methyl-5-hydroxy-6-metoxy-1,4-benzoquinol methylase
MSSIIGSHHSVQTIPLEGFYELCSRYIDVDIDRLDKEVRQAIIRFRKNKRDTGLLGDIEKKWYKSLDKCPDYSVYGDPYYFADIWRCWYIYSKKYLSLIQKDNSLWDKSIHEDMTGVKTILDLGCGIGFTSAALKELFPQADVLGTNIKGTPQFQMAEDLGNDYNFRVIPDFKDVDTDLVFASEYFEHIVNPVEHLIRLLKDCNPKYLLIANTFNQIAIGHFPFYNHNGESLNGTRTSRLFNKTLREAGYTKVKTKLWNQRPSYWKKQ